MTASDHKQAFPGRPTSLDGSLPGMELRDWFAGRVLPVCVKRGFGAIMKDSDIDMVLEGAVALSYALADAMMEQRKGKDDGEA